MTDPPRLHRILETALYVDDLSRAIAFYEDVLGLGMLFSNERMAAFDVSERQVLLLFLRGASAEASETPGGVIPGHDGSGPIHAAFGIATEDYEPWRNRLLEHGVEIESEVAWPRGGRSLYFRDPDDHALELVTPGCWETY